MATAGRRPVGPDAAARSDVDTGALARLIGASLDDAPALLRLLSAIPSQDWRHVPAQQVSRLLERVGAAGVTLPAALARNLILADHAISESALGKLPADLQLLCSVADCDRDQPLADATRTAIEARVADPSLQGEVLRALVAKLVQRGETQLACRIALAHWQETPEALRPLRREFGGHVSSLPALRVSLLGFSTTHLLKEALGPAFAAIGWHVHVHEGLYGGALSGLMSPDPEAEVTILILDQDSAFPVDWRRTPAEIVAAREAQWHALADAITAYARLSQAPLLIGSLPTAASPKLGHIDSVHPAGAGTVARLLNERLAALAQTVPSLHLVDTDLALSGIAPDRRADAKLWFYGRIAHSDAATRAIAGACSRSWLALKRGPAKVLAVDFDNTLWGGVYGDDGIERLACGDDFPGNAYKALQHECLRLKSQGMLLVGLSKNDPAALSVFDRHSGMALTTADFTATAVDWQPKPDNLRRIAAELNLGLDSFVFVDDSPHEREAMRRMCPEVIVPEMPDDVAARPQWLRRLPSTWPTSVTSEDTQRAQMYAAERQARAFRESAASYSDYLAGLEQQVEVAHLGSATLARVHQLNQRTNQFNLTGRRFSEPELAAAMSRDRGRIVLLGRVLDKFGDHGITIAAIVSRTGGTATIENLVMSCRVMQREIEIAFMGAILSDLLEAGVTEVKATYVPSPRNGMVEGLYRQLGFTELATGSGGVTSWFWSPDTNPLPNSQFVAVRRQETST